jgi:hypothetical protein
VNKFNSDSKEINSISKKTVIPGLQDSNASPITHNLSAAISPELEQQLIQELQSENHSLLEQYQSRMDEVRYVGSFVLHGVVPENVFDIWMLLFAAKLNRL